MAKLIVLDGDLADTEFELTPGKSLVLGRSEDCEICIDNVPGVSRMHGRFSQVDGQWTVEDLESQNGIYCKNNKIDRKVLEDGDVLWFSQASLRFEDGAAAEAETGVIAAQGQSDDERTVVEAPPTPDATAGGVEVSLPPGVNVQAIEKMRLTIAEIENEFGKVIVGQRDVLKQLLIALFSSGHCLMIGLPGLAKTLMVHTLAEILDLHFKRIQFTPDLMPSDIVGSDVLEVDEETNQKAFRFIRGPVFTNMLLADEINRTPPKTQAALLEAMQERHVSVSNQRFTLPEPFFVLATQNPLEQEGTYPLPEAQLDRFMFNIIVEYPAEAEEEQIVAETTANKQTDVSKILTGEQLLGLQRLTRELPASPHVIKYATRLTRATRPGDRYAPEFIKQHVACGAGPRAAQFLVLGAKARAILDGRLNVNCEDVRALALPVLRHRIFTNFTADSEGVTPDDLVRRLLVSIDEPGPADY